MIGVILTVSPTVPELDRASPGFHVKHVSIAPASLSMHGDDGAWPTDSEHGECVVS